MKSLTKLSVLFFFFLPIIQTTGQERHIPFDPIPFFSKLKIGQEWADGMFFTPKHTKITYADSILESNNLIGLTMRIADTGIGGWKLTLFFDGDRYGTLRFVRGFGLCDMEHPDPREFGKLTAWIDTVMQKKINGKTTPTPDEVMWQWRQKEEYCLLLRRYAAAFGERYYLALDLKVKNE
jgi:hypothetical protein